MAAEHTKERSMKNLALILGLSLALSACATATPYQPLSKSSAQSGGYSETRVENDRWRVSFNGNSLTDHDQVETYLLYRAAELTLAQGYDVFFMADRGVGSTKEKIIDRTLGGDPYWSMGYWRPAWRVFGGHLGWHTGPYWGTYWGNGLGYDPFWPDTIDVRTIEKFEATAEIVLSKGPKPANEPKAFDAKQVIENLGPKIVRPKP
jgi:hypothetical protein